MGCTEHVALGSAVLCLFAVDRTGRSCLWSVSRGNCPCRDVGSGRQRAYQDVFPISAPRKTANTQDTNKCVLSVHCDPVGVSFAYFRSACSHDGWDERQPQLSQSGPPHIGKSNLAQWPRVPARPHLSAPGQLYIDGIMRILFYS